MHDSDKVRIEMGFGPRVEAFEMQADDFFQMLEEMMDVLEAGTSPVDSPQQWINEYLAKGN